MLIHMWIYCTLFIHTNFYWSSHVTGGFHRWQETSVGHIKPRGTPRRAVVRIARSWENRNRDQHLYEIGFMFVDHLVLFHTSILFCILFLFPADEIYSITEELRFSYLPIWTSLSIVIWLAGLSCRIIQTYLSNFFYLICCPQNFPLTSLLFDLLFRGLSTSLWHLYFSIHYSVNGHMSTYSIQSVIVTYTHKKGMQSDTFSHFFFRYILLTAHICQRVLTKNSILC
jgi:hypothetical protein